MDGAGRFSPFLLGVLASFQGRLLLVSGRVSWMSCQTFFVGETSIVSKDMFQTVVFFCVACFWRNALLPEMFQIDEYFSNWVVTTSKTFQPIDGLVWRETSNDTLNNVFGR